MSSMRRAVLAYGLSLSSAPRFLRGFFFSGRAVRPARAGRTTLWISSLLIRRVRSALAIGARGSLYPLFCLLASSVVPAHT